MRHLTAAPATLALVLVTLQAHSESRQPSSEQDRTRAVETSRALEADPLSKDAATQRIWLIGWFRNVPDIHVKVCGSLLGPVLYSDKDFAINLVMQLVSSAGAFIIQHPEKANDDQAVNLAGLEGTLRTYESILRLKPKARWPNLDDLIENRDNGKLAEYVRGSVATCTAPVPPLY